MNIKVRLFASLREAAGTSVINMEVEEGTSVSELMKRLEDDFQGLEMSEEVLTSINKTYAEKDTVLQDGDEVGLMPPVSGG